MDGGRGGRERRDVQPSARDHRHRHQHRPRAHGPLARFRQPAEGLPRFRQQYPLLRRRRLLHRPCRGSGAGGQDHRPARRHLWLQRPGRHPRGEPALRGRGRAFRHPVAGRGPGDPRLHAADAGRPQREQRSVGGGRGPAPGHEARGDPRGAGRVQGREPPLHQGRRGQRRIDHRRLRAPPGRDRGRPQGCAAGDRGPGHRGAPAAPLFAAEHAVRRFLRLLQRGRRGGHRRGLFRGRGSDRGRIAR